ncbi:MAG: hypothetical protein VX988_04070 [Planctomycetota bacterium]|nr:hypothetical protein [Planctomycetota bacterium]
MDYAKRLITDAASSSSRLVDGLDRSGWLLLLTGVLICGMLALRGPGSRTRC